MIFGKWYCWATIVLFLLLWLELQTWMSVIKYFTIFFARSESVYTKKLEWILKWGICESTISFYAFNLRCSQQKHSTGLFFTNCVGAVEQKHKFWWKIKIFLNLAPRCFEMFSQGKLFNTCCWGPKKPLKAPETRFYNKYFLRHLHDDGFKIGCYWPHDLKQPITMLKLLLRINYTENMLYRNIPSTWSLMPETLGVSPGHDTELKLKLRINLNLFLFNSASLDLLGNCFIDTLRRRKTLFVSKSFIASSDKSRCAAKKNASSSDPPVVRIIKPLR